MRNYIDFDLLDTARICDLDIDETTAHKDDVAVRCPYCRDYKHRMFLSHKPGNNAFWCHNCGATGSAVTIYADFNPEGKRLTNFEAYREMLRRDDIRKNEIPLDVTESNIYNIRPLNERSEIYLALLKLLDLEEKHHSNLHNRGLTDEMIAGNMYRSIPTDSNIRRKVIDTLSSYYDLSGMPGFYTKNNRWQMANCTRSGFLIPVCTYDNKIQGLQIRLDEPPPKVVTLSNGEKVEKKGERYKWFSTGGNYYQNGTSISSYIHIVGDLNCDTLHITEGPLKADIASFLSGGELFIGLTGVQNVKYLAEVVKKLKPKRIVGCIDMDCRSNPHVQKAQSKIQAICNPLCDDYRNFVWPVEQKGIDDWLLFEKLKRENGLMQ